MTTYHEFDAIAIEAAIETAKSHYDAPRLTARSEANNLGDNGRICLAATCVSVTVEHGKVCLNLPLGIGSVCLPIPASIPSGTAAQACLHICTTFGVPTGVRVTVSVAGQQVVSQTFGHC